MRVAIIGAGNVGTHLARALSNAGHELAQIYNRSQGQAEQLAKEVGASFTSNAAEIVKDADIYIFSIKDAALAEVIGNIKHKQGLWVHTAGSMPMSIFEGRTQRYGVFYPMQTFSKSRAVSFSKIPFFIEANSKADEDLLLDFAATLSENVRVLSSQDRQTLHLAAVFACNFSNHMYTISSDILSEKGLPFSIMMPLIEETCNKLHNLSPEQAQTGPAIRYDENVINKHLSMLEDANSKKIYNILSNSIHNKHKRK